MLLMLLLHLLLLRGGRRHHLRLLHHGGVLVRRGRCRHHVRLHHHRWRHPGGGGGGRGHQGRGRGRAQERDARGHLPGQRSRGRGERCLSPHWRRLLLPRGTREGALLLLLLLFALLVLLCGGGLCEERRHVAVLRFGLLLRFLRLRPRCAVDLVAQKGRRTRRLGLLRSLVLTFRFCEQMHQLVRAVRSRCGGFRRFSSNKKKKLKKPGKDKVSIFILLVSRGSFALGLVQQHGQVARSSCAAPFGILVQFLLSLLDQLFHSGVHSLALSLFVEPYSIYFGLLEF